MAPHGAGHTCMWRHDACLAALMIRASSAAQRALLPGLQLREAFWCQARCLPMQAIIELETWPAQARGAPAGHQRLREPRPAPHHSVAAGPRRIHDQHICHLEACDAMSQWQSAGPQHKIRAGFGRLQLNNYYHSIGAPQHCYLGALRVQRCSYTLLHDTGSTQHLDRYKMIESGTTTRTQEASAQREAGECLQYPSHTLHAAR